MAYVDVKLKFGALGGRGPNTKSKDELPPSNISVVSFLEATSKISATQRLSLDSVKDYAIYSPSTPILRGVASDESKKSPLGLYGGGLEKGFASLLRLKDKRIPSEFFKLFDWVLQIGVGTPSKRIQSSHIHTPSRVVSFSDKYMSSAFNKLYAYDVSEGALYVFFVLLLLSLDDAPRIFALDNVDNALNPGMVRSLVSRVVASTKANSRQVFMTTHNPTALDAIDIFDEMQRIFVVRRDGATGETLVDRLAPPEGMTKEEWATAYSGMRLSNLWLEGIFEGALPPGGF